MAGVLTANDTDYSLLSCCHVYVLCLCDTGAEVDDEVYKENSVRDTVEDDPVHAQVVVEERNGDRKDDDVGDEQHEHEQVPVEPIHAHLLL